MKIKVTHAKGKQAFKAKGDRLWTVKMTDAAGEDLPALEDISVELCLKHLAQFLGGASSNKAARNVSHKKRVIKAAKRARKQTQQESALQTGEVLRGLDSEDDI